MIDMNADRLERAVRELAELKAAPRIEVTIHNDENDPHYPMVTIETTWMGYRHASMCDERIWRTEPDYRNHLLHSAMQAVIRAHAEAQVPVIDEMTYIERWYDRRR